MRCRLIVDRWRGWVVACCLRCAVCGLLFVIYCLVVVEVCVLLCGVVLCDCSRVLVVVCCSLSCVVCYCCCLMSFAQSFAVIFPSVVCCLFLVCRMFCVGCWFVFVVFCVCRLRYDVWVVSVCWLLFGVCCLLFVVWCLFFVAC